jgi:hypothetical protein
MRAALTLLNQMSFTVHLLVKVLSGRTVSVICLLYTLVMTTRLLYIVDHNTEFYQTILDDALAESDIDFGICVRVQTEQVLFSTMHNELLMSHKP